jgi:hypothetical protein
METGKCALLGKGVYKDIPDELTLGRIPTVSELDYASGEEFDKLLIDKILPASIEEKVNFNDLLDIDFSWLCMQLRIHNYGPYHTTNVIFCTECGENSYGDYQVDLRRIDCVHLPEKFVNKFIIKRDEFVDFKGDISIKIPTIQNISNAHKDKQFELKDGRINREFARICYMISDIKGKSALTPIEIKLMIEKEMMSADYMILKDVITDIADFGLRAGGSCQCPKCDNNDAGFLGLSEDRFFKPTLDDLRAWKKDRQAAPKEPTKSTPQVIGDKITK